MSEEKGGSEAQDLDRRRHCRGGRGPRGVLGHRFPARQQGHGGHDRAGAAVSRAAEHGRGRQAGRSPERCANVDGSVTGDPGDSWPPGNAGATGSRSRQRARATPRCNAHGERRTRKRATRTPHRRRPNAAAQGVRTPHSNAPAQRRRLQRVRERCSASVRRARNAYRTPHRNACRTPQRKASPQRRAPATRCAQRRSATRVPNAAAQRVRRRTGNASAQRRAATRTERRTARRPATRRQRKAYRPRGNRRLRRNAGPPATQRRKPPVSSTTSRARLARTPR